MLNERYFFMGISIVVKLTFKPIERTLRVFFYCDSRISNVVIVPSDLKNIMDLLRAERNEASET